ncbi:hypothetical protein [Lactobacillus sp. ESL0677]|uniref:hypothetical protein n=1 Tax=Lactobacillus sp. ESL0677 TaxID=2983208 RepID=UPI0023F8A005|nr:hypothetical protein [Lactobacillus sp. ESL0677]WEV36845.1 hypothetical protein OZX76_08920 [Lactobacillus sp. ESL0677]
MNLDTVSNLVEAIVAIIALYYAYKAYKASTDANIIASQQCNKEIESINNQLNPKPNLKFFVESRVENDELNGVNLICMNVGNQAAILKIKTNGNEYLSPYENNKEYSELGHYNYDISNRKAILPNKEIKLYIGERLLYGSNTKKFDKKMCFEDEVDHKDYILNWTTTDGTPKPTVNVKTVNVEKHPIN